MKGRGMFSIFQPRFSDVVSVACVLVGQNLELVESHMISGRVCCCFSGMFKKDTPLPSLNTPIIY